MLFASLSVCDFCLKLATVVLCNWLLINKNLILFVFLMFIFYYHLSAAEVKQSVQYSKCSLINDSKYSNKVDFIV